MREIIWHKIPVPEQDGVYKCIVAGKKLCLIKSNDQISVTSSKCPHAGADLTQGWCEGNKLVCPFHRHKFDLDTGKGETGQGNYIEVYPVKEESHEWFVGLKKSWWSKFL